MRVAAAVVIALVAVSGAQAQAIKGDTQAGQEVMAAYERLSKLKSYRMKIKMPVERQAEQARPSDTSGATTAATAVSIISDVASGNWLGLFFTFLGIVRSRPQQQQQQRQQQEEPSAIVEVVNPDRMRSVMQSGNMRMESISPTGIAYTFGSNGVYLSEPNGSTRAR